jgi:hypothetical protein
MHFSGFCFYDESPLFDGLIDKSYSYISSFSYGCIQALDYIINNNVKIDKLYMFSPSFFNNQTLAFKNNQLKIFRKSQNTYLEFFYKNCLYNKKIDIDKYKKTDNIEILEKLLFYKWEEQIINKIINKNIEIIVFFGQYDMIIDINQAKKFFINYATIIDIPNVGHLLK